MTDVKRRQENFSIRRKLCRKLVAVIDNENLLFLHGAILKSN